MNLILTPVYKSFEITKRMCEAIDKNTVLPYLHIIIDDDSGEFVPISSCSARRVIQIRRDVPNDLSYVHKNGLSQSLQLGFDYANQMYCNESLNPKWDYVFIIESDVIVEPNWDKNIIDAIPTAPGDWACLDVQSRDEEGKATYPCTVSPRYDEFKNETFERLHYCDFQQTLINPEIIKLIGKDFKFSDFPSHSDILFSRKVEALTGKRFYRHKKLSVLHVAGGGNSRQFLK